jgi:hypothetical protein
LEVESPAAPQVTLNSDLVVDDILTFFSFWRTGGDRQIVEMATDGRKASKRFSNDPLRCSARHRYPEIDGLVHNNCERYRFPLLGNRFRPEEAVHAVAMGTLPARALTPRVSGCRRTLVWAVAQLTSLTMLPLRWLTNSCCVKYGLQLKPHRLQPRRLNNSS